MAGSRGIHAGKGETDPTGLMTGTKAGPVVTVEVLVKQDQSTPVRIVLESLRAAVDRSPHVIALEEDVGEPAGNLLGHPESWRARGGASARQEWRLGAGH